MTSSPSCEGCQSSVSDVQLVFVDLVSTTPANSTHHSGLQAWQHVDAGVGDDARYVVAAAAAAAYDDDDDEVGALIYKFIRTSIRKSVKILIF